MRDNDITNFNFINVTNIAIKTLNIFDKFMDNVFFLFMLEGRQKLFLNYNKLETVSGICV